nr:MAG TPA: hypothetical protein [Caudoviricetes sp.]
MFQVKAHLKYLNTAFKALKGPNLGLEYLFAYII